MRPATKHCSLLHLFRSRALMITNTVRNDVVSNIQDFFFFEREVGATQEQPVWSSYKPYQVTVAAVSVQSFTKIGKRKCLCAFQSAAVVYRMIYSRWGGTKTPGRRKRVKQDDVITEQQYELRRMERLWKTWWWIWRVWGFLMHLFEGDSLLIGPCR